MAGGRFDFSVDPYAVFTGSGVTDGTTDPQSIIAFASGFVRNIHPVNAAGFLVEPSEALEATGITPNFVGTSPIDALPRLMVFVVREAGGGTIWNYRLRMRRGAGGTNETRTIVVAGIVERNDSYSVDGEPTVLEDPFPFDFMRQNVGSPALADVLQFDLEVTPGAAIASQVSFFGMMLPSQRGSKEVGDGGRGQLLGAKIR